MKRTWIGVVVLLAASCGGSSGVAADADALPPLDAPVADTPDATPGDAPDARDANPSDAPDAVPADLSGLDVPEPPADATGDTSIDAAPADAGPDASPGQPVPTMVMVPAGSFEMGDHSGLGGEDPKHPSDELPLHTVAISAFRMGRTEVTCRQYAAFLEDALAKGILAVASGGVTAAGGGATWFQTAEADATSPISFANPHFTVRAGRDDHPVTHVRWEGAAAYANWLGALQGLSPCIDLPAGTIDLAGTCYRLPTEAEWEYAAVGGKTTAYPIYPWGDEMDPARANWPQSGDPWEGGPDPQTTPVGFYDGSLRLKADFGWPAAADSYQTHDGTNGFGLVDMAGNAWEWTGDWYRNDYYAVSPAADPSGPTQAEASAMPDGNRYRVMRGGNWYNGTTPDRLDGHSRVSNRDPAYFRGPGDPNGPWFHVGFRVVLAHPKGGQP